MKNLIDTLCEEEIIESNEIEIVQYGLEHLKMNFIGVFFLLCIGVIFNNIYAAVIVCISIFPLRKYAGGFHAKTKRRCHFISAITVVAAFVVADKTERTLKAIISSISWLIIFLLAPVECKNKQLDSIEKKIYKKRMRKVLLLEGVFFAVSCWLEWNSIIYGLTVNFLVVAEAVLGGKRRI